MLNESVVDSVANTNFKILTDTVPFLQNIVAANAASHQGTQNLASEGMQGGFSAISVANASRSTDNLHISPMQQAVASSEYQSGVLAGNLADLNASVASMTELVRNLTPPVAGT